MISELVWRGEESSRSIKGGIAIMCIMSWLFVGGLLTGMGLPWPVAFACSLPLAAFILFRARQDLAEGFWLEVWSDRLRWRDANGEREVLLVDIKQIQWIREAAVLKLFTDVSLHAPPMAGVYRPGYMVLFEREPSLFNYHAPPYY